MFLFEISCPQATSKIKNLELRLAKTWDWPLWAYRCMSWFSVKNPIKSKPHAVSESQTNANKQTRVSAALFSICNKPPEHQVTASCLAHREWNRIYTWENTVHSCFLKNRISGMLLKLPARFHLRVLWAGLCPRDSWGRREVYRLRRDLERREERMLACQWSGERELSGTPVRRMNKVHLFIPSLLAIVWKQGFLKTQHTYFCLWLCCTVSLFFTLIWAQIQTNRKRCKIGSKEQYCHANKFNFK